MANILNRGLHRVIGIQFEYKIKYQEFLTEAIGSSLVSAYNVSPNTPAARTAAVAGFVGCGPAMGFETKRAAYGALELIIEALNANANVSAADKTDLNELLVNVTRYVGIAGEEDFHFMVASFLLAEKISGIIGEVVPAPEAPVGTIVTLELIDGGSGYTVDGTDEDQEDFVVRIVSTESTNPAGYTVGAAEVTIIDGVVDEITLLTDGGDGFGVDQIVALNVNTVVNAGATQKTPALARVTSVS